MTLLLQKCFTNNLDIILELKKVEFPLSAQNVRVFTFVSHAISRKQLDAYLKLRVVCGLSNKSHFNFTEPYIYIMFFCEFWHFLQIYGFPTNYDPIMYFHNHLVALERQLERSFAKQPYLIFLLRNLCIPIKRLRTQTIPEQKTQLKMYFFLIEKKIPKNISIFCNSRK